LRTIPLLAKRYGVPVGYSGSDPELALIAATRLGARMIELRVTLDATAWGADHAASLEPWQIRGLVAELRSQQAAVGVQAPSAA
jgi:N-acetylneuraminate synthase